MNPTQQTDPRVLNRQAEAILKAACVDMTQNIFQQTFSVGGGQLATAQPVVTINPRNVGLIKGFWVKAQATIVNGSGVTINLSDFGPANMFSQIQFNDYQNNTRIQTSGWHINLINSVKARRPFGAAIFNATGYDTPINYGSNWTQQIELTVAGARATSIAAGATGILTMWYWIPLAYSDNDLRGAVYGNILNAAAQLNLTLNPTPVVANGADSTLSMFVGAAAGAVTSALVTTMTITVYQNYLDQIPNGKNGPILPILDLGTIYELKNTTLTNFPANTDNPIQYANLRDFLSTSAIYVNTAAGGVRGVGADINYWALQSANFTNIWKLEPGLIQMKMRNHLQADPPPGVYYFGSREKPVSTTQYGNMQLVLNPVTANTGAYALIGWEDFALVNAISTAGSLPAS